MRTIKAGKPLLDFIRLCYKANSPALLVGRHGVGKSEILEEAARQMGVSFISRDLSLMEPTDLVGLPKAVRGRTIFLPPAFLPREGRGLLVFEELNRAERYMRAPTLQLLTARTLNDYTLPPGWLPVAAINPSDDDTEYDVSQLDTALLSRFTQVRVTADWREWLAWARTRSVASEVIRYISSDPSVFDKPESNPRAWTRVSDLLKAYDKTKTSTATLRAAVIGQVGAVRGTAFLATLGKSEAPLLAVEIFTSYTAFRGKVQGWVRSGRLDLLEASLNNTLQHLQPRNDYENARRSRVAWSNLGNFIQDLPGDLQQSAQVFFRGRSYAFPNPSRRRTGATP